MAQLIITDVVGNTGIGFLDIGGWSASDVVVKRSATQFQLKATEGARVTYESVQGTGLTYSKDAFPEPIAGIATGFSISIGTKTAYSVTGAQFDLKAYLAMADRVGVDEYLFRGADTLKGNASANVLHGHAGNDWIDGGLGNDLMVGGTGNDTFIVSSSADRVVELAAGGNDLVRSSASFTLSANVERLTLTGTGAISGAGNASANSLAGNAAANTLRGGAGDDLLGGGGGRDVLFGGSGRDVFVFDSQPHAATNVDVIGDFNAAQDTIRLDDAVFTALTTTGWLASGAFTANAAGVARDAGDRIVYETDTGKLFYDANGSVGGGSVLFAILTDHPNLTASDFLVF